jgi:hypothetical protein
MAHFLIEIPHSEDKIECLKVIQVFMSSGSHLLSNAEWGCADDVHKAWMIVDVDTKEEALQIVPPLYRKAANIVKLTKYNKDNVWEGSDEYHKA